jgi:hypothetical protein
MSETMSFLPCFVQEAFKQRSHSIESLSKEVRDHSDWIGETIPSYGPMWDSPIEQKHKFYHLRMLWIPHDARHQNGTID